MISFFVYILKLLINLFVTTILVTDINEDSKNKDKNIKFMFFSSFFTLTLISISSLLSFDNSFYYGASIIVVFLICLCATLFGFGTFPLILIGFVASIVSYIILYNSTEFYRLFFSQTDISHERNNDEIRVVNEEENIK